MKYKFCSIRLNVTKYDVTFTTRGWLRHCLKLFYNRVIIASISMQVD